MYGIFWSKTYIQQIISEYVFPKDRWIWKDSSETLCYIAHGTPFVSKGMTYYGLLIIFLFN